MKAGGEEPPADNVEHTALFYIIDASFSVARICNISIFDVFKQDSEHVVFVINYIIEKGTAPNAQISPVTANGEKNNNGTYYDRNGVKHVKVDTKTASGGWY